MKRFKTFISEGGHAVSNVEPIDQENVPATLKNIYSDLSQLFSIGEEDTRLLGSTGKKKPGEQSGDIDVAVDVHAIAKQTGINSVDELIDHIYEKLQTKYSDVNRLHGMGIISVSYPIENTDGSQPNSYVQVDFMLTENPEWTSFAYFSPSSYESKYKGVHRTELLVAIAASVNEQVTSEIEDELGEKQAAEWERYIFNRDKGLFRAKKSRVGKSGKLIKTQKNVYKNLLTQNPSEVVKILLGEDFSIEDTNSFESLWNAINSSKFKYKNKKNRIIEEYKLRLDSSGIFYPEEIR